jgi:multicomponent Na+:H+ antiporter subunit D
MFFGHDSGLRPKEAPWNMTLAMGIASAFCIGVGVFPQPLYNILPYAVDYVPYTADHVVGQLQLLMFGALAFALLMLSAIYPAEIRAVNIDTDWVFRKGGRLFFYGCDKIFNGINAFGDRIFMQKLPQLLARFFEDPSRSIQRHLVQLGSEASGDESEQSKSLQSIDRQTGLNAYPMGAGVFLAVAFLAIMSMLYFK